MCDNNSRRGITARRLRAKLRKNKESFADEFEFRMFVIICFKNEAKQRAVFEVEKVYPLMTNDCELKLMEKANKDEHHVQSSVELLSRDIVQLHARKWQSKRRDVIGCSDNIDFMVWPRKDINTIECHLFSRWRHETSSSFRPLSCFTLHHAELEAKLEVYEDPCKASGCIITNSQQTMFLFLSHHILDASRGLVSMFRMHSLCVYLPQSELMNWSRGTMEEIMDPLLANI
ncbi:uncharacterized protein C6orf62 homolog [Watersipora subatra]|uniref:uncharacterized protein C6orf62 homolog n=1 Tax=Watersipora subatra TaxID=2589382 RepID=UPI00355C201C